MKVFLIFAWIIHVSYPYVLDPIPGVVGFVQHMDFDSDGNIYAVTSVSSFKNDRDNYTLFRLNPERELLSTVNLPYEISIVMKMQVTTKGDAYFYFAEALSTGSYNNTIAVVRSGSETVEIIESVEDLFFYLDPYDNLYYQRETGVHILRPGSNIPVLIKNLEGFAASFKDVTAVDEKGNVYLAVLSHHSPYVDPLVVLTKEQLQNEVPEAKFIEVLDDLGGYISDVVVDEKNGIWVIIDSTTEGLIKKLTNETVETIKNDPDHPDLDVTAAKDRLWVVAGHSFGTGRPNIYFVTLDGKIVDVPELQNLTEQTYFYTDSLADKDGIAYIKTYEEFSPDLGPMIIINPGETKPIPVEFLPDDPGTYVNYIFMDINEDVWVFRAHTGMNDYIYVIKKGETSANLIQNFRLVCTDVNSNPVTRDIFLNCGNSLILAVNEK